MLDTQTDRTHQEERDEESDQPSDPDVAPVILIAVDTRERVDDAQTDEAEDEERTEQGSAAQIDHVVDVALKLSELTGWRCFVPSKPKFNRIPRTSLHFFVSATLAKYLECERPFRAILLALHKI